MRLPRPFRRTRPTPPAPTPALVPQDRIVIDAWGFSEQLWHELDNNARAYFRTNFTKAEGYKP